MLGARKPAKRFSLLLLEEGEHYVADWIALCIWPSTVPGNWQSLALLQGRLRLASRSLFFEPDDARIPIARLSFAHVQQMEAMDATSFSMLVNSVTRMKANGAEVPYIVDKGQVSRWQFKLPYSTMDAFLPLANEQLAAGRLPPMERDAYFEAAEQRRMDGCAFDSSQLVDFGERLLFDGAVALISPLVRDSGRLVVTDRRLYFQPLHNISGLELFFVEPKGRVTGSCWDAPSAFFAFRTEADRDKCCEVLLTQQSLGSQVVGGAHQMRTAAGILEGNSTWLPLVTAAWQHGKLSNFSYLLYCNLAAGRSFNDLTQWPVFPWVLRDYASPTVDLNDPLVFRDLSKPVGALNPSRLDMYRMRFREMPDEMPRFMYGTHYSCPGYVMYWLVRAAPAHMLRLQTGRFDAPDRLFCSVADAWESVTTNPTDVKELIPEFYLPTTSFLLNKDNLPLGTRQNRKTVGDVELPPWSQGPAGAAAGAHGSALRFLSVMRAALEAPYVSANLHHWLDLIFGFKQQGMAAVAADNVFHPLTYHGAVDIDKITDPIERAAVEAQVNEFGQTPRQIFAQPHPQRLVCPPVPDVDTVFGAARLTDEAHTNKTLSLMLLSAITAAAEELPSKAITTDGTALAQLRALDVDPPSSPCAPGIGGPAGPASGAGPVSPVSPVADALAAPTAGPAVGAAAVGGAADEYAGDVLQQGVYLAPLQQVPRSGATGGLLPNDVLNRARDRVQGLRSWSSKRLGELGSSLADTVDAVRVKGADVTRSAMTRTGPPVGAKGLLWPPPRPIQTRSPSNPSSGLDLGGLDDDFLDSPTELMAPPRASFFSRVAPRAAVQGPSQPAISNATPQLAASSMSEAPDMQCNGGSSLQVAAVAQVPAAAQRDATAGTFAVQDGSGLSMDGSTLDGVACSTSSGGTERPSAQLADEGPPHGQLAAAGVHYADPVGSRDGAISAERQLSGAFASTSGRAAGFWPSSSYSTLRLIHTIPAQQEPLTHVVAGPVGPEGQAPLLYAVGNGANLRVFDSHSYKQVRATKLGAVPLSCCQLLHTAGCDASSPRQPLLLAGSLDNQVYVYASDFGRTEGSFTAHDDAVSCMQLLRQPQVDQPSLLITGSWDGAVRIWDLAEGRAPWGTGPCSPLQEFAEHASGVYCVAAGPAGHLLLTGTEEGVVTAHDLRSNTAAWSLKICEDYVSGVTLLPSGLHVLSTAGDGHMRVLDLRYSTLGPTGAAGTLSAAPQLLASVQAGLGPLRCLATDGRVVFAGAETGSVATWQLPHGVAAACESVVPAAVVTRALWGNRTALPEAGDQLTISGLHAGGTAAGGESIDDASGLYAALAMPPGAKNVAINSIAVKLVNNANDLLLTAALDNGSLALFSTQTGACH